MCVARSTSANVTTREKSHESSSCDKHLEKHVIAFRYQCLFNKTHIHILSKVIFSYPISPENTYPNESSDFKTDQGAVRLQRVFFNIGGFFEYWGVF